MLITQSTQIGGFDVAAYLADFGGYRHGSGTTLTFGEAFRYTTLIGTGLSYDSFSQTWSGTVTRIDFNDNIWAGFGLNVQVTTSILYGTPVNVSGMSVAGMAVFFQQLMNVPGNTNVGTGSWNNDVFVGSNQTDSFAGGDGRDIVDYRYATGAVTVDLSGVYPANGPAVGDVLTSIEGVRGTAFGDVLRGNDVANLLDGAGGDDTLFASQGGDTLYGGAGRDRLVLTGIAGNMDVLGNLVRNGLGWSATIGGFESIATGDGNDSFNGFAGALELYTNGGNDQVTLAGGGDKTVVTGAGDDSVLVFDVGTLSLVFGEGRDWLGVMPSSAQVLRVVMTDVGAGTLSGALTGSFSGLEVLSSSSMPLNYDGHDGRDEVAGGLGNDTILGWNGDDLISAGNGNDLLYGDGNWELQGGSSAYGWDRIDAGGGNDSLIGGSGNDTYAGGTGQDVLTYRGLLDDYGNGTYSIVLNSDNTVTKRFTDVYGDTYVETDTILVGAADDIEEIVGTWGDDTFYNVAGSARAYRGGGGADMFWIGTATAGETVLDLGDGADMLRVRANTPVTVWMGGNWTPTSYSEITSTVTFDTQGWDVDLTNLYAWVGVTLRNTSTTDGATMKGTAHADRFESASGLDQMHGGEGGDTYVVTVTTGGFPLIFEDWGALGIDTIITSADGLHMGGTIENATLLDGAVSVRGTPDANLITGNDADNHIWGGGGSDTLVGGAGSDTYYLSLSGTAIIVESAYFTPYYDIDLGWVTDLARDHVVASASYVMKQSGLEDLTLAGTAVAGTGNLQANLITGNDVANTLRGVAGDDQIWGRAGHDVLFGGADNDRLRGDGGNDTLRGDAGDDTLLGMDGADLLAGGTGTNKLTGGRGPDQFVFGKPAEVTVVTDFTDGVDTLVFSAAGRLTEAYIIANAVQDGADVVLTTTVAGTQITVENCTIAALAGDILVV